MRKIKQVPENVFTIVAFVMDRSGSMSSLKEAAVGGYNAFIEQQKSLPGHADYFLTQFDDVIEVKQAGVPIAEAMEYTQDTFIPRGRTALRDAIGKTAALVLEHIGKTKRHPDGVIMAVMTDGAENASKEFSDADIKALRQEWAAKDWKILFLSSEPKAVAEAQAKYGFMKNETQSFAASNLGTRSAFQSIGDAVASYRRGQPAPLDNEEQ